MSAYAAASRVDNPRRLKDRGSGLSPRILPLLATLASGCNHRPDCDPVELPGCADPDLYDALETATASGNGDISRVRRGGAWVDDGWACRSAFRLRFEPERGWDHIGFRIVAVRR